ncbi:hypothetical protein ACOMHN_048961 [Nucella lapillus]
MISLWPMRDEADPAQQHSLPVLPGRTPTCPPSSTPQPPGLTPSPPLPTPYLIHCSLSTQGPQQIGHSRKCLHTPALLLVLFFIHDALPGEILAYSRHACLCRPTLET